MTRPSWDEIWMGMAHQLARRSIDPRTKVGAIIVSDDNTQVLSVGYNGDYTGGPNQVESNEPGKSGTIHAELNALIKCDYHVSKRKIMYVTVSPCIDCAKLCINGRIPEVVYDLKYRDAAGIRLLHSMGVNVRQYSSGVQLQPDGTVTFDKKKLMEVTVPDLMREVAKKSE